MYGKTTQYATDDTSPPVPASAKKHVQQVVGSLLYYALALDFTMLVALNNRLDNYFFGVPREQYGFSNNARGFMGPPSFEDAAFSLEGKTEISISL